MERLRNRIRRKLQICKGKIADCKSVVVDMSYFGFVLVRQDAGGGYAI